MKKNNRQQTDLGDSEQISGGSSQGQISIGSLQEQISKSFFQAQIPYRFICNNCRYDERGKNYDKCPKCGSTNVENLC